MTRSQETSASGGKCPEHGTFSGDAECPRCAARQVSLKLFKARSDARSTKLVHSFVTVNIPYYVETAECGARVTGKSHWQPTDDAVTCRHCLAQRAFKEGLQQS